MNKEKQTLKINLSYKQLRKKNLRNSIQNQKYKVRLRKLNLQDQDVEH